MAFELLQKYAGNVPRYTSYPTAPHFHDGVTAEVYRGWLAQLGEGDGLSLYLHIPYCDRLCWFCACHTKQTRQYAPVKAYLEALYQEIATVGQQVSKGARVTSIHLGGGSPTMLEAADLIALKAALAANFTLDDALELSVEMDPNDLDESRYDALAAIGMTRASLGVQDFDPRVQAAINRLQSFEQTKSVVDAVRLRGARSVNCDIVYGLPHQTLDTFEKTVADIISLSPDRIALFGYAHVPWMKKHQTMIDEASLPDAELRFVMQARAAAMLVEAGYTGIGIDHFARPDDSLAVATAAGQLGRNFQGYTDDHATALIGLGASSIGYFPQGYVQNNPATGEYQKAVAGGGLAVVRGIELSDEDRVQKWVIEQIMCAFGFSMDALVDRFGTARAAPVIARAQTLCAGDSLLRINDNFFELLPEAQPFARSIAAKFDLYLGQGQGRHSAAI